SLIRRAARRGNKIARQSARVPIAAAEGAAEQIEHGEVRRVEKAEPILARIAVQVGGAFAAVLEDHQLTVAQNRRGTLQRMNLARLEVHLDEAHTLPAIGEKAVKCSNRHVDHINAAGKVAWQVAALLQSAVADVVSDHGKAGAAGGSAD